jgi:hypothetical protein
MLHCAALKSNLLLSFVFSIALLLSSHHQMGAKKKKHLNKPTTLNPSTKVAKPVVGTGM